MRVTRLRTLHLSNPLGIDRDPYFSWIIESDEKNTMQESYRIVVCDGTVVVWDTGTVISQEQSFIEYEGEPLKSCTEYEWTVTVRDNKGNEETASASFETAFLDPGEWKAKWAESTIPREENVQFAQYLYGTQPPPVLFSKWFTVSGKVVKSRLYATCYGVYRTYLNDVRPDDREFAPEYTVYRNVLYYQAYDVTKLLREGGNEISMYVGDGWYMCPQTRPVDENYHGIPSVLFQLEIEYDDGRTETVVSDDSVKCCTGPVLFSDIFKGEKQDVNVSFGEKKPVKVRDYGYAHLKAQPMPPVRPVQLLPAQEIYVSPKGETIVDFGQIICGRARVRIDEPKGNEIVFEYFEIPDKEGNYFNTMFTDQKDIFVSDGKPCEYEAFFTFHGFRYIKVTGLSRVRKEDFTAVVLSTDKENAGTFSCSDERLNRLYQNIRWSQTNNMLSIPTDCPTREKAGWTGDIQIYAKTGLLNEDLTPFLTSWLYNLSAEQTNEGAIPLTVPLSELYRNFHYDNMRDPGDTKTPGVAGWSDAAVIVPYTMYRVTGNKVILRELYDTMKRWCEYITRTAREKRGNNDLPLEIDRYLWNTGFHFGEWLIPSQREEKGFAVCRKSAVYVAPFFGYYSMRLMSEIARVLEEKDDADYYSGIARKMKDAIQTGVLKGGKPPAGLMGAYVLAIAFDLVPNEHKQTFAEGLVSLLENNRYCLDTGFLATPYLLDALVKIGRRDLALNILWQDKPPSWLYQVDRGATSIWENWVAISPDGTPERTSYDHYAFGCVDDWIFRNICGLDCGGPGFKHIIIDPQPDGYLSWCKRTFQSEYGAISVYWTENELEVTIPCNTTATVIWKGKTFEIGSGTYKFD